jgi:hypothetical protein
MSIFRNTGFFKSFAASGLFRRLFVLATAGYPLPNIQVRALKKKYCR